MKFLFALLFLSLNANANAVFRECFDLGLDVDDELSTHPSQVCYFYKKEESQKKLYVDVLNESGGVLASLRVSVLPNPRPAPSIHIELLMASSDTYQVEAQTINGGLSFTFLRDYQTGRVYHEITANPNSAGGSGGCHGGGRCRKL